VAPTGGMQIYVFRRTEIQMNVLSFKVGGATLKLWLIATSPNAE
jgi:hypothetical protein